MRNVRLAVLGLAVAGFAALGENCAPSPYAVRNLRAAGPQERPCSAVIAWDLPATQPPSGISGFAVFRDGVEMARRGPGGTSFVDPTWLDPQSYTYSVRTIDGDLTMLGGAAIAVQPSQCPPPPPVPQITVRALLMKFPDFTEEPYDLFYVDDLLFRSEESLSAWWSANSFGQQEVSPAPFPVHGWYTMPYPISHYCDEQQPGQIYWWRCDTFAMVQDAADSTDGNVNWFLYPADRLLVFFSGFGSPVGQAISVQVPGSTRRIPASPLSAQRALAGGWIARTVGHEMGHLSGLPHAMAVDCPSSQFPPDPFDLSSGGCTANGLESGFDPMGTSAHFYNHFSVFSKLRLGFLPQSRVRVVPATTEGTTVKLYPVDRDTNGTQMVKVPTTVPSGSASYYFVEYRPVPTGSYLIVRLKPGRNAESYMGEVILPAAPFVDEVQGIRIARAGGGSDANGSYATLRIDKP